MPALSPTMTAGNIGTWQKKPGDTISPGDVLVEIETDKAQMDFEFQEEGILAKILKESGEKDVAVGNPIAVMIEEGEDASAFESFTLEDAGGEKSAPAPPKEEASESSEPSSTESGTAPPPKEESKSVPEETESSGGKLQNALDRQPNASIQAFRLAHDSGINLAGIKGTGKGGQITEADVKKAASGASAGPVGTPAATYEDIPTTSMRKTIASRLTESFNQNPHYFVAATVSVSKLLKLRLALNASSDGKFKLSVNDFLIKACAVACKKVPTVNSSWRDGFIRQFKNVDISVAVATPAGLMTPIVKSVEGLGLESISAQVKDLGKRARDGKLKPEEYQGGTFTISNMGMNPAIDRFTAVVNPPQAGILAVGTTKKVAIPVETEEGTSVEWDDQIVVTGSFDHKVVDGAVGGEWIREFKKAIENPLELLLKSLYATTLSPRLIYALAASSPTLFSPTPTPHLLLTTIAPQLTTWALTSSTNLQTLHNSFVPHGIPGLLALSLDHCRITLTELRALKHFSISILTPLSQTVSRECGPLSTSALPRAEQEDDEQYDMICEDPCLALLQFALFGALFQPDIRAVYEGGRATRLGWKMRKDWWGYCVPDVNCERVYVPKYHIESEETETETEMEIEMDMETKTGMEIEMETETGNSSMKGSLELNMLSLSELLHSPFWCSTWNTILSSPPLNLPPYIPATDPRHSIYKQSLQGLGLSSLMLLQPDHGLDDLEVQHEIEEIRGKVLRLQTRDLKAMDDLQGEECWELRIFDIRYQAMFYRADFKPPNLQD
ncbi:hypothetical protein B7494_g7381 [Chlorociboria aeruginascens]|nr:hypothetical protein B7494_g7381 [Chlorociboria aeruginascens]